MSPSCGPSRTTTHSHSASLVCVNERDELPASGLTQQAPPPQAPPLRPAGPIYSLNSTRIETELQRRDADSADDHTHRIQKALPGRGDRLEPQELDPESRISESLCRQHQTRCFVLKEDRSSHSAFFSLKKSPPRPPQLLSGQKLLPFTGVQNQLANLITDLMLTKKTRDRLLPLSDAFVHHRPPTRAEHMSLLLWTLVPLAKRIRTRITVVLP